MNIWVIGRSYPLDINNLQGSFELEQAKMLADHGNKVSYLACVFHPFKKVKKWGYQTWKEDGLRVHTYSQPFVHERMKLHLEAFKSRVWKKLLSRVEAATGVPDVIHVHYPANITIASMILDYQKRGTKVICTEHWTQVQNKVIDKYERTQLRRYADHADTFICVGYRLKKSVLEMTHTKRKIEIVPNIVNPVFKVSDAAHEGYRFVAVGVLFPHKQFDKTIKAFAAVFKGQSDVTLTVIGDGVEAVRLRQLVADLGMEKQVILTGRLSREDTAHKVAESDCLICYSSCETFGVPVIEAWASGIPVIASTATAVVDKWDERLGAEVDCDNIRELQKSMKEVMLKKASYDKKFISEFALQHYSEDAVYKQLADFYCANKGADQRTGE